ncbi:MAG: hypothetical protein IKV68_02605 [Oscillospiraceae bacterium]|nr:hypothetical protein [Oscillospiraceae bacterium]
MKYIKNFLLLLSTLVVVLLLAVFCFSVVGIVSSQSPESDTLLMESHSPNGTYLVKAFRTNPGATVDYSIRCYVSSKNYTGKIYDAYHEASVSIEWITDDVVSINDKQIDLSKKEAYSWRNAQ